MGKDQWVVAARAEMRGERLLLRAPRAADKKDRLACGRDPELVRMYGGDLAKSAL